MKNPKEMSLTEKAMCALDQAVVKVIEDHRKRGKPLAMWRDGKAVWVTAEEALRERRRKKRMKKAG